MRLPALLLLHCACSGLTRGVAPARESPVLFRVARSECPRYHLQIHQDGLLEYDAASNSSTAGPGWKQLSAGELEWLGKWDHSSLEVTDELERKFELCRGFGTPLVFVSVLRDGNWRFVCADASGVGEAQLLSALGVSGQVALKEPCFKE